MDRSSEEKTFLIEESYYLKRRTDERQSTQRENTQQRSSSVYTYTQPTQLTLLEHRFQPTPPLTGPGRPCRELPYDSM